MSRELTSDWCRRGSRLRARTEPARPNRIDAHWRAGLEKRFGAGLQMLALVTMLGIPVAAHTQSRPVPDTYTATTTAMTPSGLGLKFDVIEWSDDEARASVISTLQAGEDISKALSALPTAGVVWPSGSAAGYALKYAHRAPTEDGGERITFVTDKPVGTYSFKPWIADNMETNSDSAYSVIELYLDRDGNGVGTMSLAADVVIDDESGDVRIERRADAPNVLTSVTLEPKPYWAKDG